MQRRLIILRHVKSPHPAGVDDHDRPIDGTGRRDAGRVAERLGERGWVPETGVPRDARRASETWTAVQMALDLCAADVDDMCEVLWGLDDEVDNVIIVGHNPGFSDTTTWLTGVQTHMPKGAAALLTCEGETWADAIQKNSCHMEEFIRPKALL